MYISATSKTCQRSQGFTLLELLVVLVLMGVILSITVLSIGDGGRGDQIRKEAQRLTALMMLAGDEALMNTTPYGLQLKDEGYRFLLYRDGQWQAVDTDELLGPREWPEEVELKFYQDGMEVALPVAEEEESSAGDSEVTAGPKPALVFYPDGERTPFELDLRYRDSPYLTQRIKGGPFGPLELERREES